MIIQKEAILAIQQGYNSRIIMLLINSHVSLEIHNISENEIPEYESLIPSPKDAVYEVYECVEGFKEILNLDGDFIKKLMRELDSQELAKAIRNAGKEMQNVFLNNMSERSAEMLMEDVEYLGEISKKDMEEAQRHIINVMNFLKKEEN
jgi:DNA-binding GntR family transcriptional regulator